jgi:hypothetical protein
VTRRLSRLRSSAALALAVTAVAAPVAVADSPAGGGHLSGGGAPVAVADSPAGGGHVPSGRLAVVARHDAARPQTPADVAGRDAPGPDRSTTGPVVVSPPAQTAADGFDWLDAGIGSAALAALLALATAGAVRIRGRAVHTA